MSETAEFPLPNDVTPDERETARRELSKYTTIQKEDDRRIVFEGRLIGQTGPVWHYQYTRIYRVPKGYIVAAHDLREGIVVRHAERPEDLPSRFEQATVREFIEDELRFRGVLGADQHAAERARA